MLLAKSCFKKDNLKARKTIRLGSLYEYRETESKQIADSSEGKISFKLKFDGKVEVDRKWFNTITENSVRLSLPGDDDFEVVRFPGSLEAYFEKLQIDSISKDTNKVVLIDSSAIINREALNSFIFCISHVRKMRDSVGIFADYDDCWYMMASMKDNFARKLGRLLLKKIKEEHQKGNFIIPKETNMSDLKVHVEHGSVSYVPREIHINNDSDFTLDDFMSNMYSMAFIKPPTPFSKEKEYRFLFTIISEGNTIVPRVNSLIIDAEPLLEFLI